MNPPKKLEFNYDCGRRCLLFKSHYDLSFSFSSPSHLLFSVVCQICTGKVEDPRQCVWLAVYIRIVASALLVPSANKQDKSVVGFVPLNCVYIPVNFQGTHRSRIINSQQKTTTKDTMVRTDMMGNFISAKGKGTSSSRIISCLCPSFPCRYPLFIRSENFGTQTYWLTVTLSWHTNSAEGLVLLHYLTASKDKFQDNNRSLVYPLNSGQLS